MWRCDEIHGIPITLWSPLLYFLLRSGRNCQCKSSEYYVGQFSPAHNYAG